MKQTRIVFLFCFASLLFAPKLRAQDSIRSGSWLSADIHYGFILPLYTSSMNILIQGHIGAAELDYTTKQTNPNSWLGSYHSPEVGIAFFSAYLNNASQLGNMYGIYPFISFHLNRSFKEHLYFRVGLGLGYMSIKFDPLDNHKNDVIGSHLNAMINLRLNYHFYVSDNMRLETGLGVTHCSNGAYQTPNLGINLVTANVGVSYNMSRQKKSVAIPFVDTAKTKKIESEFIATAGLSEIEPPGEQKYLNVTLSYIAYKKLNSKNKLGLGADIFYNKANIARLNGDSVYLKNSLDITQFGLKVAYELTIGKLSLPLEMGGYVYTQYTGNGYFYNRLGIRYYAGKHIILDLTALTHFAKADYLDCGIGYTL